MLLSDLLRDHEPQLLNASMVTAQEKLGGATLGPDLEKGLTEVYGQIAFAIAAIELGTTKPEKERMADEQMTQKAGRNNARYTYKRGLTVSQLVNAYGSICQAITQYAHDGDYAITPQEFNQLNLCIDVAIARAVTEYQTLVSNESSKSEKSRTGHLIHDLRNALAGAILSYDLLRGGSVDWKGPTGLALYQSLENMKMIIDRSVAQARMGANTIIDTTPVNLLPILSQVESGLIPQATLRSVRIHVASPAELWVRADPHLLTSAVANLVQNAVKFTQWGSHVHVRAFREGSDVVIEVEDQCGGIPEEKIDTIFHPRGGLGSQGKGGMGLGLIIAMRAVELNGGVIEHVNSPGEGCKFVVRLPEITRPPQN